MADNKSDLEKYFESNTKRLIHKWDHYFDIYERHLSKYRGKEVTILEIGVFHGGSLQMWKYYFGDKAKIYGVDINPRCKELEEENVQIFIGSQSDRDFLSKLKTQIPKVDILIEDGGHMMKQQIVTFEEMYDHVAVNGTYICEDIHSSYMIEYGGGYKRRGTFVEYSKNLIDQLNAFFSQQRSLSVNEFTSSTNSMHYYDSVLVIEKAQRKAPVHIKTGTPSFKTDGFELDNSWYQILKRKIGLMLNYALRFFKLPWKS